MDIVERLRFDATRCEVQFSKGVASNIEEAANEIEQLRADAARYRYLRDRPEDSIGEGGLFAGMTPPTGAGGYILTEEDLDAAIDKALAS